MTLDEMVAAVREAGYVVFRRPACAKEGRPHAPHSLRTSTIRCEGREPFPHGFVNCYYGSFGIQSICACGKTFDYDGWTAHAKEHGIGQP